MICQDLLQFVVTSSTEGDGLGVEGLQGGRLPQALFHTAFLGLQLQVAAQNNLFHEQLSSSVLTGNY